MPPPLNAAQDVETKSINSILPRKWRVDGRTPALQAPIPKIDHDSYSSDQDNSDIPPEEGDHILATGLLPLPSPTDIRASSISQQLAEAFKANSKVESPPILEYLKEFTSVFSKKTFDVLPEPKEWNHAIEIIPGSKASNCKVYPLSPLEQKELDMFLKENLETGCI